MTQPRRIYTSRTATLEYQRCPRARWLGYFAGTGGRGVEPNRKSWHLCLGSAVHAGLEVLLRDGAVAKAGAEFPVVGFRSLEARAVVACHAEFDKEAGGGLVMDGAEAEQRATATADTSLTDMLRASLAAESKLDTELLGGSDATPKRVAGLAGADDFVAVTDGGMGLDNAVVESAADYTRRELRALAEAMVRAYCRRRLGPLLDEFDVLEVEREGEWKLGDVWKNCDGTGREDDRDSWVDAELWFASRPDALLLHRATQTLHLMSFKTTGCWDARKERDAQRDVQGLSEAMEVERRLAGWWQRVHQSGAHKGGSFVIPGLEDVPSHVIHWLHLQSSAPRIHAVRYEYLVKGHRAKEDRGPRQGQWTSRSPLIRGYYNERTGEWAHSWTVEVEDELGTTVKRSLSWAQWKGKPTWDDDSNMPPEIFIAGESRVKRWIDNLDCGVIQPGASDPLAAQFPAPVTVCRNDDDLRDWLEQVERQEVEVARNVALMRETPLGHERSNLNVLFPQFRRSCSYPGDCWAVPICFGSDSMRADPEATGEFRARTLNHPQEAAQ